MKKLSKLATGMGLITALCLLSTSALAGGSFGFSVGFNSGSCAPRYYGGYSYSYSYCPAYYCRPAAVYYYAPPPPVYYTPSVVYQPRARPNYFYYGGNFYIH